MHIHALLTLPISLAAAAAWGGYGPTASSSSCAYPQQKGRGYDYSAFPCDQATRASAVVEQFRFAWDGYYRYAFPNDELRPSNKTFRNGRNGWGATAVDALSTAVIMEQVDIVDEILRFVPTVDFTRPKKVGSPVSLFETNIRYIGGMLSAYDLLKGPFAGLPIANRSAVDCLVTQAQTLANTLKFAFNTPSGIPVNWIYLENHTFTDLFKQANGVQTAGLAEIGSLTLEWQRLSDLTGDASYAQLVRRAESHWLSPQPQNATVWPGLTGGNFSCATGYIQDQDGGFISGYDSAYEYLIKAYVYNPDQYAAYGEFFEKAADSGIEYLKVNPARRPDLTYVNVYSGKNLINQTDSLSCFAGGMYLLGSSARNRPEWKEFGLALAEFCASGYRSQASGIGPLAMSWNETEFLNSSVRYNQSTSYTKSGYWVEPDLLFGGQAPESVESWYYAYQLTGNQYWRDVAWAYTVAQNKTLRKGVGFSDCLDVFQADGGGNIGVMQSFMLAEVLKYQYLIQSTAKGEYHVFGAQGQKNQFVFNTEAHPLRVAAKTLV